MTALLELSGVQKRFGGVLAVAGIDLAIPAGSIPRRYERNMAWN